MPPLYEAYPELDPLAGLGMPRRRYSRLAPSPVDPVQDPGLARRLGQPILSGLSAIGTVLDTPGAFVRTALAGENPLASIFDPSRRVGGRELLERYGALGANQKGLDAGDVVGFGAEVLFDPLSWMTFGAGALTKAGKAAKGAGLLDDVVKRGAGGVIETGAREGRLTGSLRQLIDSPEKAQSVADYAAAQGIDTATLLDQPLGGLANVRTPFGTATVGTGPTAQKVARGMDKAAEAVRFSAPGRIAAAWFNPAVKGVTTREGQLAAEAMSKTQDASRRQALTQGYDVMQQLERVGIPENKLTGMLDVAVEPPKKQGGAFAAQLGQDLASLTPGARQAFEKGVDSMRNAKDDLYRQHQEVGLYAPELLDEQVEHFPRYLSGTVARSRGGRKLFDTGFESTLARKGIFRDLPEARSTIEAMAKDPALVGPARLAEGPATQHIVESFGITDGNQARKLSKWFGGLPDELLEPGSRIFGSPVRDYLQYELRGRDALEAAKGVQQFLADHANSMADSVDELTPIADVLKATGHVLPEAKDVVNPNAIARMASLLGADEAAVHAMGVPKEIAADATRMLKGFTAPESVAPLLKAYDDTVSLWKTGVTSPFPAFHGRNRLGGLWQNFVIGGFDPKVEMQVGRLVRQGAPIEGAQSIPAIKRMLTERSLEPTAQNATKMLQELAFTHEVIGRHQGPGASNAMGLLDEFQAAIPGRSPVSPVTAASELRRVVTDPLEALNPLNVRGIGGRTETTNAIVKAGQDVGYYVETMNRLSPFVKMLRDGIDPAAAAAKVKAAHIDYSNRAFTDAERAVLTRLFPFYKFSSRMMPFTVRELMERPGGKVAQSVRAADLGREDDPLAPPHVSGSLSIGLGETDDGTKRFLTGFGLPHEDPLSLLQVAPGSSFRSVGSTGMELLGRVTPGIKMPFELATGRQLWAQGRELRDADPTLGRLVSNVRERITGEPVEPTDFGPWVEFLAPSVPYVGRTASTLRSIADPRKSAFDTALNMLTGVRVTDVSPAAQEAQLRDILKDKLRDEYGGKVFTKVFVPKTQQERLSPEEATRVEEIQSILNMLTRRKTERQRAAQGGKRA